MSERTFLGFKLDTTLDWSHITTTITAIVAAAIIMYGQQRDIQDLHANDARIEAKIVEQREAYKEYREEYKKDIDRILTQLDKIVDKLERKADR